MYIIIRALVSNWYEDAAEIVVFSKKASMTQLLTRSPAVARKSRPYRLRRKPNVRLLFTERKRFLRGEQFHARYVNETLFSKATINASITHVARGNMRSSRQAIKGGTLVNNQQQYRTQVSQILLTIKKRFAKKDALQLIRTISVAVLTFKVVQGQ